MDGWMFLAEVRSRPGGSLPAIAVSAYAGDAERARSHEVGFDAHLAKPIELDELTGIIGRLVAAERDRSSAGNGAGRAAGGSASATATKSPATATAREPSS